MNIHGRWQPPTTDEINDMVKLHADGYSVRQIAKRKGWGVATVSKYLHKAGADIDRSKTHEATIARKRRLDELKLDLAEQLWDDIESLRDRIWEPYETYLGTGDGIAHVELDEPPLRDQHDGVSALQKLVKMVDDLTANIDTDSTTKESSDALTKLREGITKLVTDMKDKQHQ
ncbi:hypothetical protein AY551_01365 [Corynebacterium diphtheriae bv. gravis]|uniref:helix-turn-helix domain-containing protein n=1 Tax=Corynebacterium diphtheriae TaxID=1717 RepID=UPI000B4BC2D0|nr:helix-turn-helix domain-containing protein [Corynebacterium diphtheriae]OWN69277.1 hypothetical protein AY518_03000 [Corynebacterium diphtheriae bv. gravis]OWO50081.1 hypothetical protein AY551_01365 [Corynebacterium diphtheriae bv. gravis]CAB1035766.1 hypothetical protein NCTC10648_01003 [Corynebacterium diphtheriae]